MPAPSTTGAHMGYPSSVDTGQIAPLALYDGEIADNGVVVVTANQIVFVGQTLRANATLHALRCQFNPGGSGHYDLGIYDSSGTVPFAGGPGVLLAHTSATASVATSTAVQTPTLQGGDILLPPGNYWLALWGDNALDKFVRHTAAGVGMGVVLAGTVAAGPLPANASSVSGLASIGGSKPILIGLWTGGWS